ncbi:MAG: sodium:solute symporter family protein [Candidatus Aminicenantes bacterium]|nr:MAG: sodium:solute symporter family protein [Candidatus Aminicenantes bacterium]
MKLQFFIFLFAYFIIILFVGFFFSKRMKNLEDYFLASRNLPAFLVYMSLAASWLGATSILVSVDEAFRHGVSSFWVMGMPAVITVLLFGFFLARPIRRLPIITLPDLVEMRYGRVVRHLASLLIVWYMVVLASSQMVAIGKFLELFLGTSYFYSLVLGTSVVLVYSIFGGFFSVVITDSIQFFLLSAGVLSLFFFLSGTSSLKEISLLASRIGRDDYFNFLFDFKKNFLILLSFTLAWIISPIVWQRIQAARTTRKAQQGLFAVSGTFFLLYWFIVFIGILSLPLFSSQYLEGPILSELISSRTGFFLSGVLFVAVVAAIMSTMDTAINTGALALTRDLYQQIFSSSGVKSIVSISRLSSFLVGALAFLVATRFQSILKTLGLASEIMAEGLFIPGIAMIFLKKKLPMAGFLSLVLGGGYSIVGFLCEIKLLKFAWPQWPYSVPYGVALSLVGFIIGSTVDLYLRRTQNSK